MKNKQRYVDVILPLPVKGVFTYLTIEDDISIGKRVVVQFGARKLYTAIVKQVHNNKPDSYEIKPILVKIYLKNMQNKNIYKSS